MLMNKNKTKGYNTDVSPATQTDIKKVSTPMKIYNFLHGFIYLFTYLDYLWPFNGYGLIVEAKKVNSP